MADDERRAELEAVARALYEQGFGFDIDADPVARESMFSVARVVLDRVRDARGDDEGCPDCHKTPETCWLPPNLCKHPARSPQGEDHEAGLRAARNAYYAQPLDQPMPPGACLDAFERAIAAYLSRVSPSRDGTVVVEDVVRWLRDRASPNEHKVADAFEAKFRPATGEQTDHGGNQDDERRH